MASPGERFRAELESELRAAVPVGGPADEDHGTGALRKSLRSGLAKHGDRAPALQTEDIGDRAREGDRPGPGTGRPIPGPRTFAIDHTWRMYRTRSVAWLESFRRLYHASEAHIRHDNQRKSLPKKQSLVEFGRLFRFLRFP